MLKSIWVSFHYYGILNLYSHIKELSFIILTILDTRKEFNNFFLIKTYQME